MPYKSTEARREQQSRYRQANRESINASRRGNRAESSKRYNSKPEVKLRNRFNKLFARVGMTQREYETMFEQQNGLCKLCAGGDAKNRTATSWSVDHCHETGAVRGILCNSCNLMLGHAKEDAAVLKRAAEYLEAWRALAALQLELERNK